MAIFERLERFILIILSDISKSFLQSYLMAVADLTLNELFFSKAEIKIYKILTA